MLLQVIIIARIFLYLSIQDKNLTQVLTLFLFMSFSAQVALMIPIKHYKNVKSAGKFGFLD